MPMGRKQKKWMSLYMALVLTVTVGATTAFAAGDPLSVINNLSTFIFSLIRAIGLILLGFGVVQVGLSLKSHDPSQRANGFLTLAGGVIITFAKEILDLIMAQASLKKYIRKQQECRKVLLHSKVCSGR